MRYVWVAVIILFTGLFVYIHSSEATSTYRQYTIKKGDTLWDISEDILEDPFLWPKIWKENPQIKNPDLIFPGQRLKIPLKSLQKQISPSVPHVDRKEPERRYRETARKGIRIQPREVTVVRPELITSAGYIDKDIPDIGYLVATPSGRTIIGTHDEAYLQLKKDIPHKGDRFFTINPVAKVYHPDSGEFLGYLIEITGIIEVVAEEAGYTKVKVLKAFSEIEVSSPVDYYVPVEPLPMVAVRAKPLSGTIIASKALRILNGTYDIVFIDRGTSDGVVPGNVFTIISSTSPRRPIGKIQVISARQETSAAMIISSEQEITIGDRF